MEKSEFEQQETSAFSLKDSKILHGFSYKARLISAFIIAIVAISLNSINLLIIMVITPLVLLIGNLRPALIRLIPINLFMLFVWFTLPFTMGVEGLTLALKSTLKANSAALWYIFLIIPVGVSGLTSAMKGLHLPDKLISVFLLTIRQISIAKEHLSQAFLAMQLRRPEGVGTVTLWKLYASIIATTLIKSAERAERVQNAMVCRGFDGSFPTSGDHGFVKKDILLLFISAAFIILIGWLNYVSYT